MKATKEQVEALAIDAGFFTWPMMSKTARERVETLVHLAQQFTLDQLRSQGVTAWMFKGAILRDAEYPPSTFAGTNAEPLYRIPETLE